MFSCSLALLWSQNDSADFLTVRQYLDRLSHIQHRHTGPERKGAFYYASQTDWLQWQLSSLWSVVETSFTYHTFYSATSNHSRESCIFYVLRYVVIVFFFLFSLFFINLHLSLYHTALFVNEIEGWSPLVVIPTIWGVDPRIKLSLLSSIFSFKFNRIEIFNYRFFLSSLGFSSLLTIKVWDLVADMFALRTSI